MFTQADAARLQAIIDNSPALQQFLDKAIESQEALMSAYDNSANHFMNLFKDREGFRRYFTEAYIFTSIMKGVPPGAWVLKTDYETTLAGGLRAVRHWFNTHRPPGGTDEDVKQAYESWYETYVNEWIALTTTGVIVVCINLSPSGEIADTIRFPEFVKTTGGRSK